MTLTEWLRLALRQKWLLVLGALATCLSVLLGFDDEAVYWSHTTVQLVPPTQEVAENVLISSNEGLISLAGVVVLEANRQARTPRLASDGVSIVDAGITEGRLIRLPNAGGQWATNFDQATVDVQVSGPSPAGVESETERTLADLDGIMSAIQDRYDVDTSHRVSLQAQVGPSIRSNGGRRVRYIIATVALGTLVTVTLAMAVDQRRLRYGRHRRRRARVGSTTGGGALHAPRAGGLRDSS